MKHNIQQRLSAAKTALILDHPFYGALATRLKMIQGEKTETMETDGTNIYYNVEYAESLTDAELVGIIAHEVMHPAMNHHTRRDNRDHKRWNHACDYAINGILLRSHFKLPGGGLHDPKYDGMSAEQIYDKLPSNPPGGYPKMPGGVLDAKEDEKPAQEAEWMIAVKSAAQTAKMMGNLPGELEALVTETLKPKVDWRSQLRQLMQIVAANDYTWTRPNGRFMQHGIYLPTLHGRVTPPIILIWDSSGSTLASAAAFKAEIDSIIDELNPERVYVVMVDARVHRVFVFEQGEIAEFPLIGGGGTDFCPAFDWLDGKMEVTEEIPAPPETYSQIVFFTDCYGTYPQQPPEKPITWASVSPPEQLQAIGYFPPFGTFLHIDEHETT